MAYTSRLPQIMARVVTDVGAVIGSTRTHNGLRDDLDEVPTWRYQHWDSAFTIAGAARALVRGADVTLVGGVESAQGIVTQFDLRVHTIAVHYWLQVYDVQDGLACTSELLARLDAENICQGIRTDITLGGYADGGLVADPKFETSWDIETKGGVRCHHCVIQFACRERAIQR